MRSIGRTTKPSLITYVKSELLPKEELKEEC